jgi:hypothetical protein
VPRQTFLFLKSRPIQTVPRQGEQIGYFVSLKIDKWKQTVQDRAATQKQKQKAMEGLIGCGIRPMVVRAWLVQGAPPGEVDRDTKVRRLKWVIGKQSGTTGEHKRRAIEQLLEFGVSSSIITEWSRQ